MVVYHVLRPRQFMPHFYLQNLSKNQDKYGFVSCQCARLVYRMGVERKLGESMVSVQERTLISDICDREILGDVPLDFLIPW